jgi:2-amino-4-hydroxy-6-hydroxymethyldihydropteridine diphosphokinase
VIEDGWTKAVIALGANQGDCQQTLLDAVSDLRATEGVVVVAKSSVIETVALTEHGYDDTAPAYVNQVVIIHTAWPAEHLLARLHEIEHRHGRLRDGAKYAPRTLDLDIIDWGGVTMDIPGLTLPHPRAHERTFVLAPWLEVDPEAEIPGRGSVRQLLAGLESSA